MAKDIYAPPMSVLDVGCGDGSLLKGLTDIGYDYCGLDLPEFVEAVPRSRYVSADFSESIDLGTSFDLMVANMVVPWIHNLDGFAESAHRHMNERGRLIMSIFLPEYSKNGYWVREKNSPAWLITKGPERDPEKVYINESIGPLIYYSRTIFDYLNILQKYGLLYDSGRYLYCREEHWSRFSVEEMPSQLGTFPRFAALEFVRDAQYRGCSAMAQQRPMNGRPPIGN
jgi:SAM-dependent methyltransferase